MGPRFLLEMADTEARLAWRGAPLALMTATLGHYGLHVGDRHLGSRPNRRLRAS
jgi:hypothetical protein